MTVEQLRKSEEYFKAIGKIRKYPKGFQFTLFYSGIPRARANALEILMHDCIKMGACRKCLYRNCLAGD